MKEVNVINTHVPGSTAARIAMRNEIRALIMEKGLPSFYITINPADVYNPLVKFLSGSDINIDNLLPSQIPDYTEQSILVAKNPFVAARFFNIYLKAFLKIGLGFDPENAASQTGILGPVSAYYGCVEAQGRGTLHCHMIVWLKDALNCDEIRERVLSGDHEFQERMINFIDDCISNEVPPPPTTTCTVPSDDAHPCSVRGVSDPRNLHARLKDLHNLVNSCQRHKHSATCYKYYKGPPHPKECRFDLGEHRTQPRTEFDTLTGEMKMRYLDGLVNNFNATIIQMIRCNMDIQFMGSGPSTKAIIYYITDYITKAQLKAHIAYAALELAVKKLEEPNPEDDTSTIRAKKLLQKCAYAMIAQQELSGQQVASYLLDLEDHFTSHTFRPLYWTSAENTVNKIYPLTSEHSASATINDPENNEPADIHHDIDTENTHIDPLQSESTEEVIIGASERGIITQRTPYLEDYIQRGVSLAPLSLWEYTSLIEKMPRKASSLETETITSEIVSDDGHHRPKYGFLSTHPDHTSHCQQLRLPKCRPLPCPIGPSLPRRDKEDSKERYCRLMLVLLKPWNEAQDLLEDYPSWQAAFKDFIDNHNKWHKLLNNMQLLHECRDCRDDHFEERARMRFRHPTDNNATSGPQSADDFSSEDPAFINEMLLDHLTAIDSSRSIHIEQSAESVNICLREAQRGGIFRYSSEQADTQPDDTSHLQLNEDDKQEQAWDFEYERRRQTWRQNMIKEQDRSRPQCANEAPHAGPSIARLNMDPPPPPPTIHNINTTVNPEQDQILAELLANNIEQKFTLNPEQSRAFKIIAQHSVQKEPEQLRMFIGGPGGTGKSRIIDALREYFHSRNEDYRFRLASFTGVAAKNIRGMTLHTALNLNQRRKRTDRGKADLIAMWRRVDYLIIDEVSMIGCKLLLHIHEALCEAKENTKPFGGVNIIFAGDFAQLPPVGDTKLYAKIKPQRAGRRTGQDDVFGRLLWLSVNTVVLLHRLVRQNASSDSQFTDLLAHLRHGTCTTEDFNFLNSKLLRNRHTNFDTEPWCSSPIIVSNNNVKDRLNLEAAKTFAARNRQKLHFYHALDRRLKHPIDDPNLKEKLLSYDSGKTDQRLGHLPLCKGMPVMLTHNYVVSEGIVNGCIGTIQKINYTFDNDGNRHAHSCIVRSDTITGPPIPGLQANEFAVVEDDTTLEFTHPHSNKTCTFRRTQLPIVPAFVTTAHKSQGNTVSQAVVDLESCLSNEAAYVMLSRVRSSDNLRILRPFNIRKITTHSSEDLRKEFRRLEYLDEICRTNLESRPSISFDASHSGVRELERAENLFNSINQGHNDMTDADDDVPMAPA